MELAKASGGGEGRYLQEPNGLVSGVRGPSLANLSSRQATPVPQSARSPGHTRRALSAHPRHASQSGQHKSLFIAHFLKVVHLGGPWGRMCEAGDTWIGPDLEPGAAAGRRGPCPGAGPESGSWREDPQGRRRISAVRSLEPWAWRRGLEDPARLGRGCGEDPKLQVARLWEGRS